MVTDTEVAPQQTDDFPMKVFVVHVVHVGEVDGGEVHIFQFAASDFQAVDVNQPDLFYLSVDAAGLQFGCRFGVLDFFRKQLLVDNGHGSPRVDNHVSLYAVNLHFDEQVETGIFQSDDFDRNSQGVRTVVEQSDVSYFPFHIGCKNKKPSRLSGRFPLNF